MARQFLIYFFGLLLCTVLGFYLKTIIYKFPDPEAFHGRNWYNPYSNLAVDKIKANFHAHTISWKGFTNGNDTEEELVNAYRAKNYQLIGISNYYSISEYLVDDPLYIPIYEHGTNIPKVHNLVIGATKVRLPGFPVHFSLHQAQQMLERTSIAGKLNVLAHPGASRMSLEGLSKLSGYNLMEVGNTSGINTAHWDAALSAGKPVWLLFNDDTHDLEREPTFVKWNIIFPRKNTAAAVIEALRVGQHYGVESYNTGCENYELLECSIRNDSLMIRMSHSVNRIDLIGQDAVQMASIAGRDRIAYALEASDAYIRAEVHMDDCVYYLNPVIRISSHDSLPPLSSYPPINTLLTWSARIIVLALIFLTIRVTLRLAIKFDKRSDS